MAVSAALALSACGGDDPDESTDGSASGRAAARDVSVTFLPKNLGNPYFDTSDAGGERAVEEFGGTYEEVGPDTGTPDAQVPFINTAAQQGVSALVVSANDPTAIGDALNEARDAGVKVVTFDSDTDPEFRDLFINQASPEGIAKAQVDLIAEQIGDEGEIAILSASANATNQNAWIELMEAELDGQPPEHQARRHRLRRRRRPDVVRQDRRAAPVAPGPQGHHLARPPSASPRPPATCPTSDVQGQGRADRSRHAEPDARVRRGRHRRPRSRCGTPATSATSRRRRPRRSSTATITGEEGDTFKAGELGEYTVGADGDGPARRPVRVQRGQHRRLRLLIVPGARPAAASPPAGHHRPSREADDMQRVCFQLQVKPDRLDEYRRRHEAVWPEMLAGPRRRRAGTTTRCSCATDGLLIGYFETDSLDEARARDGTHGGQRALAGGDGRVLRGPRRSSSRTRRSSCCEEVFNLDDQLARHDQSTTQRTNGPPTPKMTT